MGQLCVLCAPRITVAAPQTPLNVTTDPRKAYEDDALRLSQAA
jgi:hypothetical protein